jgi:hypothetical protein
MLSRLAHADPDMQELQMCAKGTSCSQGRFKNGLVGIATADRNKE